MADWHAIVIEGPDKTLRAFTAGFLAGRGEVRGAVLHGPDIGVEAGSFGERLHSLLHGGRHEVLLVDGRLGAALTSALAGHADDLGIRVTDHAVIVSASWPNLETLAMLLAYTLVSLLVGAKIFDGYRDTFPEFV